MTDILEVLKGNTLRFEAEFRNWDAENTLIDPSSIKFRMLNLKYEVLEEFVVGSETRMDLGKYYFLYAPNNTGFYYYEWYCEIDGLPTRMVEGLKVKEVL